MDFRLYPRLNLRPLFVFSASAARAAHDMIDPTLAGYGGMGRSALWI
jgi:hypothetical protein